MSEREKKKASPMTIDRIIDPQQLWFCALIARREREREREEEEEEVLVKKKYLDVRVRGHSGFLGRRFDLVDFHFLRRFVSHTTERMMMMMMIDWRQLS